MINTLKCLEARYSFGNWQRPVLLRGVSQLCIITNQWKYWLNWSSKMQESLSQIQCFRLTITSFSNTKGVVSHNVLCYQHFSSAVYQVSLYAQLAKSTPCLARRLHISNVVIVKDWYPHFMWPIINTFRTRETKTNCFTHVLFNILFQARIF